ncbi:hypothetical protein D9Q98_005049 [Chlorella vulgaris]|uniref:Uncharacterized protein n=1 Tax=Chlorella vulgaris TaxID=3077 RepID=A0A9D4YXA9_CHLVU|nr:hypothetical protein D9Q98_005049 [Chlorella vulgaris]
MARRLVALLALLCCCATARAVISCGGKCYDKYLVQWGVGTLGPICMCPGGNSVAQFSWAGTAPHGVFQIESDACPSNFTGFKSDSYQELAPVSLMDDYDWNVPKEEGDYWVTSQAPNDCANGILAQIRVSSSSGRATLQLAAAAAATLLALAAGCL